MAIRLKHTPKPRIRRRTPAPAARARAFFARPEVLIALAAFLLSLVTAAVNVWFAVRASEVDAQPLRQIYLYRDGNVLSAAANLTLVNRASAEFGDVVTAVRLEIQPGGAGTAAFISDQTATPLYSEDAERRSADCPAQTRCVRNGQFLVMEEPGGAFDVPGGSSRTRHVGFVLLGDYCAPRSDCSAYSNFTTAAARLSQAETLVVRIRAELASDGPETTTCRALTRGPNSQFGDTTLAQHLAQTGWVALGCE